jgi:hypothetical protein
VAVGGDPDVDDARDPVVRGEVLLEDLLVVESGVVRSDDDAQLVSHGGAFRGG